MVDGAAWERVVWFGDWSARINETTTQLLPPGGDRWMHLRDQTLCKRVLPSASYGEPPKLITTCMPSGLSRTLWSPTAQHSWSVPARGEGEIFAPLKHPILLETVGPPLLSWTVATGEISEVDAQQLLSRTRYCADVAERTVPDLRGTVSVRWDNAAPVLTVNAGDRSAEIQECLNPLLTSFVSTTGTPFDVQIALTPNVLQPGGGQWAQLRRHMRWVDLERDVRWETEPMRAIYNDDRSVPRQALVALVDPSANLRDGVLALVDFDTGQRHPVKGLDRDCPGRLYPGEENAGRMIVTCASQPNPSVLELAVHWSAVLDIAEESVWMVPQLPLRFLDRDRLLLADQKTRGLERAVGFTRWSIGTLQ